MAEKDKDEMDAEVRLSTLRPLHVLHCALQQERGSPRLRRPCCAMAPMPMAE